MFEFYSFIVPELPRMTRVFSLCDLPDSSPRRRYVLTYASGGEPITAQYPGHVTLTNQSQHSESPPGRRYLKFKAILKRFFEIQRLKN